MDAHGPVASVAEIFPWRARLHPDKEALVTPDRVLTYSQLDSLSNAAAAALAANGFGTGDVVSLFGQNSWQWIVTYHGALKAGCVVNPANVMLTGPELRYMLDDCAAKGLFLGAEQAERVSGHLDESRFSLVMTFDDEFEALLSRYENTEVVPVIREPEDLGSIGYTSGTTGHPKGAMQTLQSVLLNCAYTATMHGKTSDDVILTALPAVHVYGNVALNGTFLAGGTVILMERFDPVRALDLMVRHRITVFEGVPAMYSMLLARPEINDVDLSFVRLSTVGGQTISTSVIEKWEQKTGARVLELWGMTEISGLGTTHAIYAPPVPGSVGAALPGVDIAVGAIDGGSQPLPPGTHGELMIRGPVVMLGYLGRPEATAEVLGSDGWLRTGDVAYLDDRGYVFVVDRLKDMIVTAGYNVYPAEIERVIASHPDVGMVAVGPRPDEVKGEIAVAYIVPRPGVEISAEQIQEFCAAELAPYKRPRDIVFVESLPTTSSGKLMRRKLADLDCRG